MQNKGNCFSLNPPYIYLYRNSIQQSKKGGWCKESFVRHVEMFLIGFLWQQSRMAERAAGESERKMRS